MSINAKDKIEISLRAGMIGARILDLIRPISKLHSKLVIDDVLIQIKDLLVLINSIKEE
jgi:hypothetical protein